MYMGERAVRATAAAASANCSSWRRRRNSSSTMPMPTLPPSRYGIVRQLRGAVCRVAEGRFTRGVRQVQQVQPEPGHTAGQVVTHRLPLLTQDDVDDFERLLPVTQMRQRERGAVQAVVQPQPAAA